MTALEMHVMIRFSGFAAVLLCTLSACSATAPETGDLGSFFPPDIAAGDGIGAEVSKGEAWCFSSSEGAEQDLSVVGQVYEMAGDNLFPGHHTGDVTIKIFDVCGLPIHEFDVPPNGGFAFHLAVGDAGYDAYFEFPHRPEHVAEEDFPFGEFPLIREFDKPFHGAYIHSNLRLFNPDVVKFPLKIVDQQPEFAYVQGTIYNILDYETVVGAVVTPSSGDVWYISDQHIPDSTLNETQHRGMFIVANCDPGPIELLFTLPGEKSFAKRVTGWPMNTHPNNLFTSVGVPVDPELLP